MNNSELIADFINSVAKGDSDAARDAFSKYCNNKAKGIASGDGKVLEHIERFNQFKKTLLEYGNDQTPLRMEGDKIFVNNKFVGRIHTDMNDFESGINFISDDGSFSKEFDTAEDLFKFLSQKFLGEV
jgi:hypothetical protein